MSNLQSIIVPVWNHLEDLTKPFLDNLLSCEGDFEVIVVDNGSTDGTREYLTQLQTVWPNLVCVFNEKNRGFGGGNNDGYARARGEEICFISNDVEIKDRRFLTLFSQALKNNPKACYGPMLVDYNQLTTFRKKVTPYIAGWCVYGSKKMFDQVAKNRKEVFNEDFGLAYFEDVWLSVKCVLAGYALKELKVDLHHKISGSSDQIDITKTMQRAKNIFLRKMSRADLLIRKVKRIVFYVPSVPYPFNDTSFEGKGVGGAEASLILLARAFAKLGWQVDVYNKTETSGKFNGVEYHQLGDFRYQDYADVFVLFRAHSKVVRYVNAKTKIFWSCDQYTDPGKLWTSQIVPFVDKVVGISEFHAKYIGNFYKIPEEKLTHIDLGVNWSDYKIIPKKKKGKTIFCSVPRRGLDRLLKLAPMIKEKFPSFSLTITSDYRLWGTDENNEGFKQLATGLDYVSYLGKIPRSELVQHQLESQVMAYPSNYDECFCIAAMECMAAGAVPVTIDHGAIKTTVGTGGVVLSNKTSDEEYVESVVKLLKNPIIQGKYRKVGRAIAEQHDWNKIVESWLLLLNLLEVKMAKSDKTETPEVTPETTETPENVVPAAPVEPEAPAVEPAPEVTPEVVEAPEAPTEPEAPVEPEVTPEPPSIIDEVDEDVEMPEEETLELEETTLPGKTLLEFSVFVEVTINGAHFEGKSFEVPDELVPSILDIVHTAYGDVLV